jgi:hypothetical protein
MSGAISMTARATDAKHLELSEALEKIPETEVRVLIFLDVPPQTENKDRAADFLNWARRARPAGAGLPNAGRDLIYED